MHKVGHEGAAATNQNRYCNYDTKDYFSIGSIKSIPIRGGRRGPKRVVAATSEKAVEIFAHADGIVVVEKLSPRQ
jgi:hypothetical protein